jgi:hypothetical protein
MYVAKPGIKSDPERRWALPDRIFFGYGACHILAGTYLAEPPLPGFYAERIIPDGDGPGNHVYVTDSVLAFDYHGYSVRNRLLDHHGRVWASQYEGWSCVVEPVAFCLLSTRDLNARKMRGPDQYWRDVLPRARRFIAGRAHAEAAAKALALSCKSEHARPGTAGNEQTGHL